MGTSIPSSLRNVPGVLRSVPFAPNSIPATSRAIPQVGGPSPSGLVDWLKADSLALSDGTAVSIWADSSATGNSYTQSGGARPVYKANVVGALPGVLFDGISQFMTGTTSAQGAMTVYTVFNSLANPTAGNFFSCWTIHGATGPVNTEFIFSNISGAYQPYSWRNDIGAGGLGVGIANALDTSIHALQYAYNGSGNAVAANYTASLDNASQSVIASSTLARTTTDLSSIGARSTSVGVGSAFWNGYLFERLVYSAVQSAGDQAATLAYLNSRWGV